MVKRYIVGLIMLSLVILIFILLAGGGIAIYLDISSTFILVFGSLFALFMFYTPGEIKTAFKHAFTKEADKAANYKPDIILFSSLHTILTVAGLIGLLTGTIAIFSRVDDLQSIGRGLAQALLVNLYAFILQLILTIPCKAMLEKKQNLQQ